MCGDSYISCINMLLKNKHKKAEYQILLKRVQLNLKVLYFVRMFHKVMFHLFRIRRSLRTKRTIRSQETLVSPLVVM